MNKQLSEFIKEIETLAEVGDPKSLNYLLSQYRKMVKRCKSKIDYPSERALLTTTDIAVAKLGWHPVPSDQESIAYYFIHNDWVKFSETGDAGLTFLLKNLENPGIEESMTLLHDERLSAIHNIAKTLSPLNKKVAASSVIENLKQAKSEDNKRIQRKAFNAIVSCANEEDKVYMISHLDLRDLCALAQNSSPLVQQTSNYLVNEGKKWFLRYHKNHKIEYDNKFDELLHNQRNYPVVQPFDKFIEGLTEFKLFDTTFITQLSDVVAQWTKDCEEEDTSDGGVTLWQMHGDWIIAARKYIRAFEESETA